MLTILIPTYNYPVTTLVKGLCDQLKDLHQEVTVFVFEDGSTEYVEENSRLASCANVIYKHFPKNKGRTAIRSLMAKEAATKYLLFLDADVLPLNKDFLHKYLQWLQDRPEVIFGGIAYDTKRPPKQQILRWKYGKKREAKPVKDRLKAPYFIISQNLLIQKELFLKANDLQENLYGLDNYFSFRLMQLKAEVMHTENPVVHYGLESSASFIKKALEAVKTTVILENQGRMADNMRPIQKSYLQLRKWRLTGVFASLISLFKPLMERNFHSNQPNLRWFDLYRLHYYILLKRNHA